MFQQLLHKARALGASDLLLESDTPVVVRVRDEVRTVGEGPTGRQLLAMARSLLGESGWQQFEARGSADLSVTAAQMRCRVNVFRTVRGIAIAARVLNAAWHDLNSCNLHPDLAQLVVPRSGLVIISGPTGSGKSTTLAALLGEINASSARNIIVLESPIEYLFSNRRSFIRQREIPAHSPSYEQAIVDALRENPDLWSLARCARPK